METLTPTIQHRRKKLSDPDNIYLTQKLIEK